MKKSNYIKYTKQIIELLKLEYPDVTTTLDYLTPLQLLISTQLAAQCTDERVNKTTPALFARFSTAQDFVEADTSELERLIYPTGFYKNKARNIKQCCEMLIRDFNGVVPDEMEQLIKLPGVGRKTANVVLAEVFGKPAIIVDTHAKRISNRIGLTDNTDPDKIEQDLLKIIPQEEASSFSHRLVFHGRAVCKARTPLCAQCVINKYCRYYFNEFLEK